MVFHKTMNMNENEDRMGFVLTTHLMETTLCRFATSRAKITTKITKPSIHVPYLHFISSKEAPTHHQTKVRWVPRATALLAVGPYFGSAEGYGPIFPSSIKHIIKRII